MAASTLILVNPKARSGEVGRRWPEFERQVLGALGDGDAKVEFTTAMDFGSATVRKGLQAGRDRILVVGGDGTISEAIQGFFHGNEGGEIGTPISRDAVLMVLPAGRGDDFFKSMIGRRCWSSEDAWSAGLELLRAGQPQATDLGRVRWLSGTGTAQKGGERYFVNLASFGFPGLVVQRVREQSGPLGRSQVGKSAWTYLLQIATGMASYRPLAIEVQVDGQVVFDGPLFSGFVLNGCYNAGGMRWADESRIDDGVFEIVLGEPRSPLETLLSGARIFSGHWKGAPKIHCFSGRKVRIWERDPAKRTFPLFEIDGDQPESAGVQGAEIEVMPGAIRLWR